MESQQTMKRRPIAHFFVKPALQAKLTAFFVGAAVLSSFGTLGAIYLLTRINLDGLEGLRTAWYYLKATYPGFLVAGAVSLLVGVFVGIWASRKVALPIYKVEQWSRRLREGNLQERLGMRAEDYWGEMAASCNRFTEDLARDLAGLDRLRERGEGDWREALANFLRKYRY